MPNFQSRSSRGRGPRSIAGEETVPSIVNDAEFPISDAYVNGQTVGIPTLANNPIPAAGNWVILSGNTSSVFDLNSSTALLTVLNDTLLVGGTEYTLVVDYDNGVAGRTTGTITVPVSTAGSLLYILSFVNQSATPQAADKVWYPFGVWFNDGDLGPTEYFELYDIATSDVLPISTSDEFRIFWPSGNTKWMPCAMRGPAVAGNATCLVGVRGGGSAPTPSGLTLSTIDPGDVTMRCIGETGGNFDGTNDFSLDDVRANPENEYTFMDGPAGKFFVAGGRFKNGGTPDVTARGMAFVHACLGPGGVKLGYRYFGLLHLWDCEIASASALSKTFQGALYREGGTGKVRDFQGYKDQPVSNVAPELSAVIRVQHYTGAFASGEGGEYDWIQGDGSDADEPCTMGHPTFDYDYFKACRLAPPVREVTPTSHTSVTSYYMMGKGGITTDSDSGWGFTQEEASLILADQLAFLRRQSQNDFRRLKTTGLSCAGWYAHLRRMTTFWPPTADNGSNDAGLAWPGLGAPLPAGRYSGPGGTKAGVAAPPNPTNGVWGGTSGGSGHRPVAAHLPYIILARPELLELVINIGCQAPFSMTGNATGSTFKAEPFTGSPLNSTNRCMIVGGTKYYMAGMIAQGGLSRGPAQLLAPVAYAWLDFPPNHPRGGAIHDYLDRALDQAAACQLAYFPSRNATWQATGVVSYNSPYSDAYHYQSQNSWTIGFIAAIKQTADWLELANVHARKYQALHDAGDVVIFTAYVNAMYDQQVPAAPISAATDHVGSTQYLTSSSIATQRFTITGGATITNGDTVCFVTGLMPNDNIAIYERLLLINVSGNTFQVAKPATPSTPETITRDVSWSQLAAYYRFSNPGLLSYDPTYFRKTWAATSMLQAAGATEHLAVAAVMDSRAVTLGQDTAVTIYAYDSTFEAS